MSWQAWKKSLITTVLLGCASVQAMAADLTITATPSPVVVGSPVGVDILISGVSDLFGYQFSLSFNPSILQATGMTEGSFLLGGGSTYFGAGAIDNTAGTITFTFDALMGNVPGVSGNGVLAHVDFNTAAAGSSSIAFSDVLFLNSLGNDITMTANAGTVTVSAVPEPASLAMFGLGIAGLAALRRRQADKEAA